MLSVMTYNVPHLIYWDWRIAADLFFGGAGVGAFLVAVLNSLVYKDKYPSVSKVGAMLAPILIVVGLVCLLAELGHPFRIWRTVTGFNPSSPLSWGGLFQTLLIAVSVAYAWLWFRGGSVRTRNLIGIIGIPLALVVGAYHGWLLTIVRARPLWNTGPAMVTALVGFVTTGMAIVLLVLCLVPRLRRGKGSKSDLNPWMLRDFRHLLTAAMIVQGMTFFIWWISLLYGPANAQAALAAANADLGPVFWAVGIGLGLVLPILLQLTEIVRDWRDSARLNVPLTIATTVLILVGGYVFRHAVVLGGQLS